jgi:hypothetical protein
MIVLALFGLLGLVGMTGREDRLRHEACDGIDQYFRQMKSGKAMSATPAMKAQADRCTAYLLSVPTQRQ